MFGRMCDGAKRVKISDDESYTTSDMHFLPNGLLAVQRQSEQAAGFIEIWDGDIFLKAIPQVGRPSEITFVNGTEYNIYLVYIENHKIHILDRKTGEELKKFNLINSDGEHEEIQSIVFDVDAEFAIINHDNETIGIWDTTGDFLNDEWTKLSEVRVGKPKDFRQPLKLRLTSDYCSLLCISDSDEEISIFDITNLKHPQLKSTINYSEALFDVKEDSMGLGRLDDVIPLDDSKYIACVSNDTFQDQSEVRIFNIVANPAKLVKTIEFDDEKIEKIVPLVDQDFAVLTSSMNEGKHVKKYSSEDNFTTHERIESTEAPMNTEAFGISIDGNIYCNGSSKKGRHSSMKLLDDPSLEEKETVCERRSALRR